MSEELKVPTDWQTRPFVLKNRFTFTLNSPNENVTAKNDQFETLTSLKPMDFFLKCDKNVLHLTSSQYNDSVCGTETGQIDPVLIERYNTPGFVGCLSRVQFNSVAPLKVALRSGQVASVSTTGILVPSNCGALPLTLSPAASASDPWHHEAGRLGSDPVCSDPRLHLSELVSLCLQQELTSS